MSCVRQWKNYREWLNKFVISTGAKRSGEICGFSFSSHTPTKALIRGAWCGTAKAVPVVSQWV
jgi:hypothetical protein